MKSFMSGLKSQKPANTWEPQNIWSSPESTWSSATPTMPSLRNSSRARSKEKGGAPRSRIKREKQAKDHLLKLYSPSKDFAQSLVNPNRQQSANQRSPGPSPSAIRFIWPTLMCLKSKARPVPASEIKLSSALDSWGNDDESAVLMQDPHEHASSSQKLAMELLSQKPSDGLASENPEISDPDVSGNSPEKASASCSKHSGRSGSRKNSRASTRASASEKLPIITEKSIDREGPRESKHKKNDEEAEKKAKKEKKDRPEKDEKMEEPHSPSQRPRQAGGSGHWKPEKQDMITIFRNMTDAEFAFMSFTVDQQATIHNYFVMYDMDGSRCMSRNELISVFRAMGRGPKEGSTDQAVLDYIMSSLDANSDGELQFEEFLNFLQAFYSTVYKDTFLNNALTNGKLTKLPKKNLMSALKQLKEAGFDLNDDKLDIVEHQGEKILDALPMEKIHAGEEEGKELPYGFTFEQFQEVLVLFRQLEFEQLRRCAGFDPDRVAFVESLFGDADVDGSGSLDIKEVAVQFQKAGIPIADVDEFVKLFARMDIDKSASLSLEELLRLMSIYSSNLESSGFHVPQQAGAVCNLNFKLDSGKTWKFKENAKQVLSEADDVFHQGHGAAETVNTAIIEELEHGMLAKQLGLSVDDMRSLRESFEFCDADGSGLIDREELNHVLQNLGFPMNTGFQTQVFQSCLDQLCLLEGSMGLDFARCIEWIFKYFLALARASFEEFREGDGIPRQRVILALYQIGRTPKKQMITNFLQQHGLDDQKDVDFETFMALISFLRSQSLREWRQTCGFSPTELEKIKEAFDVGCPIIQEGPGKGKRIEELDLTRVEPIVKALGYILDKGSALLHALARVHLEGTGKLTFHDFLLLVRHLENNRLLAVRKQEEAAVRASGLDSDAANLLREVFNSYPKNDRGEIQQNDVKIILSRYKTVATQNQRKRLAAVLEEVVHEKAVSFANFLSILKKLDDINQYA